MNTFAKENVEILKQNTNLKALNCDKPFDKDKKKDVSTKKISKLSAKQTLCKY